MHKLSQFIALCSLAVAASFVRPAAAADYYLIDPAQTSIVFSASHSMLSYTYGMFREASGSYVLDKENPERSRFVLTIKSASLFTNDAKRDEHLRGPDFFDTKQFPEIKFETVRCSKTQNPDGSATYLLTGNFTMHGVTRSIDLPLRLLGEGPGPYKDHRTGFHCQVELKRSDFGMDYLIKERLVGDAIGITISFEGVRQEPRATGN